MSTKSIVKTLTRSVLFHRNTAKNRKLKYKLQYCKTILCIGRWRGRKTSSFLRLSNYESNQAELNKRWCWLHDVYLDFKKSVGAGENYKNIGIKFIETVEEKTIEVLNYRELEEDNRTYKVGVKYNKKKHIQIKPKKIDYIEHIEEEYIEKAILEYSDREDRIKKLYT